MEYVEFEQRRRAKLPLRGEFCYPTSVDIGSLNSFLTPILIKFIEQEFNNKYSLNADRRGKDGCYKSNNPVRYWKIELPKNWLFSDYVGEIVPEILLDKTIRICFYILDPYWETLKKAIGSIITELESSLGNIEIKQPSATTEKNEKITNNYNVWGNNNILGSTVNSQGEIMSDTYNMSGDFHGSILNINSTLSDVCQSINTDFKASDSIKAELVELINQLENELKQVPEDKGEEAEAVAESAKLLVETANKEKPNKAMIQISGDGLKQAAMNLASVTPIILTIATQIIDIIMKYTG